MRKVNLNEYVKFKLTEHGCKKLDEQILHLRNQHYVIMDRDYFIKVDEDGNEKMQVWQFMQVFGEHMYNGAKPIIENNDLYFE